MELFDWTSALTYSMDVLGQRGERSFFHLDRLELPVL